MNTAKIIVVEFKGASDRYTLHLLSSMANMGIRITLFSIEDCILEPNAKYVLYRIFPSYSANEGNVKKLFKYIKAYIKIFLYAKKESCRVVHFQYFRNLLLDCSYWILLLFSGFNIIYTAHNVLPHEKKYFHKIIFKFIYKIFDAIIVTSNESYKQMVEEFKVKPSILKIIPIGYTGPLFFPKTTKTEAREILGFGHNKDIILFFGLIREYKGVDILIEAAERLADRFNELTIVVAGTVCDQVLLNKIEKLGEKLTAKGVLIKRLMYIPDKELPYYMLASDVVVLPYKRMSGHSSVLFLAYKFSRPVIATSIGGLKDAVHEGKTGYLCKPEDPNGLAECIEEALINKDRLATMGKNGNNLLVEGFSWVAIGKDTNALYRKFFLQDRLRKT